MHTEEGILFHISMFTIPLYFIDDSNCCYVFGVSLHKHSHFRLHL